LKFGAVHTHPERLAQVDSVDCIKAPRLRSNRSLSAHSSRHAVRQAHRVWPHNQWAQSYPSLSSSAHPDHQALQVSACSLALVQYHGLYCTTADCRTFHTGVLPVCFKWCAFVLH